MNRPRRPAWRRVDGVLLLDKPAGMSSNQALQRVRHLYAAEHGGHTGSLDPLAIGMLPLCFGEATKIAGLLLGNDKAYEALAVLGTTTDTDDADGEVLRQRPVPPLTAEELTAALAPLQGAIRQRPPIYSALKQGGEALYRKARRGELVEVPEREVRVDRIELLGTDLTASPPTLRLFVQCGSGTYIRSLVRDLGEALGCGAHVAALRRTWVAPFAGWPMHPLPDLQALATDGAAALDALLLPIEQALPSLPRLHLDADAARRLQQGQAIAAVSVEGLALALGPEQALLGLVDAAAGHARARRLLRTG